MKVLIGNSEIFFFGSVFAVCSLIAFILMLIVLVCRWRIIYSIARVHYIAILSLTLISMNFMIGMGLIETGILGGTAFRGTIEQDRFYLGRHGVLIPVSRRTYIVCEVYEKSLFILGLLSFITAVSTYHFREKPGEIPNPEGIETAKQKAGQKTNNQGPLTPPSPEQTASPYKRSPPRPPARQCANAQPRVSRCLQ